MILCLLQFLFHVCLIIEHLGFCVSYPSPTTCAHFSVLHQTGVLPITFMYTPIQRTLPIRGVSKNFGTGGTDNREQHWGRRGKRGAEQWRVKEGDHQSGEGWMLNARDSRGTLDAAAQTPWWTLFWHCPLNQHPKLVPHLPVLVTLSLPTIPKRFNSGPVKSADGTPSCMMCPCTWYAPTAGNPN